LPDLKYHPFQDDFFSITSDGLLYKKEISTKLIRKNSNLIQATLHIINYGENKAIFPKNSRILSCENGSSYLAQNTNVIIPGMEQSGSASVNGLLEIQVDFHAESLFGYSINSNGLNSISCQIDPDNVVSELLEDNNSFDLRLFHPNSYPDVVIDSIEIEPLSPITVHSSGNATGFKMKMSGRNIGADMKRSVTVYVNFGPSYYEADDALVPGNKLGYGESPSSTPGTCFTASPLDWDRPDELNTVDQSDQEYIIKRGDTFTWDQEWSKGLSGGPPLRFEVYVVDDMFYQGYRYHEGWAGNLQQVDITNPFSLDETWNVLNQPAEYGSEGGLVHAYQCGSPGVDWIVPHSYTGNNIIRGEVFTKKPAPYALYPTDGKVFNIGNFPDFQSDWRNCCFPNPLPEGFQDDIEWKAEWIDNALLRFRWMQWGSNNDATPTRLEIMDNKGKMVFDEELNVQDLSSIGGEDRTGHAAVSSDIHDEQFLDYWVNVRGFGEIRNKNFRQYIGPNLAPGIYTWRVQFGSKNTDKTLSPWSEYRSFKIATDNLSEADFFGKVTEIDQQNTAQAKVTGLAMPDPQNLIGGMAITVITGNGQSVSVIVDQSTVINDLEVSGGGNGIAIDKNIMISADQPPAIGRYLSRSYMAVAKEITIIPSEPLSSHKRCTVFSQADNKSSLTCADGEQFDVEGVDLPTGTDAVLLIHPEKPVQVISTAKSLIERMNRFQSHAENQNDNLLLDSLVTLNAMVSMGFQEAQQTSVSKASPEIQEFLSTLKSIEQKILDVATKFSLGNENVVLNSSDVSELIILLTLVADSPDKLVDSMIDGFEDDTMPESSDELKALIKAASSTFFSKMSTDLYAAILLLEDGNIESAMELLDTATSDSEIWEADTVMPLMNSFYTDVNNAAIEDFEIEADKLREDAKAEIELVNQMFSENGDWLDPAIKEDIQNKVNELAISLEGEDIQNIYLVLTDLVQLMQSTDINGSGDTQGSLADLIESAKLEISSATSQLDEQYTSSEGRQRIQGAIDGLENVLDSNDRDKIFSALKELGSAREGSSNKSPVGLIDSATKAIESATDQLNQQYANSEDKQRMQEAVNKLQNALDSNDNDEIISALENLGNVRGESSGVSKDSSGFDNDGLMQSAQREIDSAVAQLDQHYHTPEDKQRIQSAIDELENALSSNDNDRIIVAMEGLGNARQS
jgi:hypothetical protein